MLAYAANQPRIGARHSSPNAMLAIIALHVGALAVLMSAKLDLPTHLNPPRTDVFFVPTPKPPRPDQPVKEPQPRQPAFSSPVSEVPLPNPDPQIFVPLPQPPLPDYRPGPTVDSTPTIKPQPLPVRTGARLLTPASELKPPYPQSKLLAEEEATLKLRLTIDERGRVVAVDAVERADPAFLESARRYLIAHWRYKPASEDGRPLVSTEVITLRFQLDG